MGALRANTVRQIRNGKGFYYAKYSSWLIGMSEQLVKFMALNNPSWFLVCWGFPQQLLISMGHKTELWCPIRSITVDKCVCNQLEEMRVDVMEDWIFILHCLTPTQEQLPHRDRDILCNVLLTQWEIKSIQGLKGFNESNVLCWSMFKWIDDEIH